ncbi:MAG: cyclic nucleotide-binding domain-containing protein [Deltaproteobacteria bacterium]|nr:cyclic nucleotide-binding domain-containing protein [Deltaproteobacteria bacterium]MBI2347559.1 cyclic nucleotide-binding domain-containing protein [Deltaproteobacteria bacterium]MBI2539767.1 cyclic nucleotide-binding domain-containing protein [Deltaproteobacteria bacterium]MBI3062012.1 cyclic nucleotide-binding domain-containing protein [Deltaproteobacteria bacterium]
MAKELPLGQGQWEWLGQTLSRHANAKMAPDVIKLVMPGVRLLEYEDNAAIVVENDIGYAMYVIYQGRVLVVRKGNKIAELETGDFFGEISLVTRAPRTATVKAVKNCQVFELSWRAINAITECFPQLMQAIQAAAAKRMEELAQKDRQPTT